jgi:hypothetical protein
MVKKNGVYRVGEHVFACLDITDPAARERGQLIDSNVAAVHVDPPWGAQATRYFNKLAGKEYCLREEHCVLEAVASFCWMFMAPEVFVLMGSACSDEMARRMSGRNYYETNRWSTSYRPDRSDCNFSRFAPKHTNTSWEKNAFDGVRGDARSFRALSRVVRPGDVIADPCIGLGQTLRLAHRLKCRCSGVEIVPERLERTVALAERLTGINREEIYV